MDLKFETSDFPCNILESDVIDPPRLLLVELCGNSLMNLSSHKEKELVFPHRSYFGKIVEIAMRRNTITVVKKGRHKIPIILRLIKVFGKAISVSNQKKIIVVAPAVVFVAKQYETFKSHSNLRVFECFTANEQTLEDLPSISWMNEIAENDVIFMTPDNFLLSLINASIKLEYVSLLIFDECHLATGSHSYVTIMKEFYHKLGTKPKFFGVTASHAFRKGAMGSDNFKSEIQNLMDCEIMNDEEWLFCRKDETAHKFYSKPYVDLTMLKEKIKALWNELTISLSDSPLKDQNHGQNYDKFVIYKEKLNNELISILACLVDFGVLCAREAVGLSRKTSLFSDDACQNFDEILTKIQEVLDCVVHEIESQLADVKVHNVKALETGYVSPKVFEFLRLLKDLGKCGQMECFVYVESSRTAILLETTVHKSGISSQFLVAYLVQETEESLTEQKAVLFEVIFGGKVSKLTTADMMERLCMPNCSVILFDVPKTVSCYIQCRRIAKENDSECIIMLERENLKQRDEILDLIVRSKQSDNDDDSSDDCADDKEEEPLSSNVSETFTVGGSGVSVSRRSCVGRLYQYFETLVDDGCAKPVPAFEFEYFGDCCRCRVKLPSSVAVQAVFGPWCKSVSLAKQLTCLEACKKLHQVGLLNDHFIPSAKPANIGLSSAKECGSCAGAGTTKRKELHGTTKVHALQGNWKGNNDGHTFNAYKLTPVCSYGDYAEFLFLVESKLDDDVGEIDLDLYMVSKTVKFTSSYFGEESLDSKQIHMAKHFHELFFNGLFGSLYSGCKKDQTKDFLLQSESWSLWNTSNMYLLLPLLKPESSSYKIDWETVHSASLAVKFLRQRTISLSETDRMDVDSDKALTESMDTEELQFANCKVDRYCALGMAVMSIHSGRFYIVLNLMNGMSAMSPFIKSSDDKRSNSFSTYEEYFQKSHKISLKFPEQPFLQLKQSHNPYNLLVNFRKEATAKKGIEKPRQNIHMPPELLYFFNIPARVLKSFYLFPSIFQRFQSLMLASQLRKEINCQTPNFHIPSLLMLEAITTMRSNETFSFERLEFLGDSVLKYGVTCHTYLTHLHKNEGYLSDKRKSIICNETLHNLGTSRKLQGYIRDYPFEPLQWQAPGHILKPQAVRQCQCGVDTLEVPLQHKYHTDKLSPKIGMPCEKGHRWLVFKSIADCVEAVIGAYYVSGGIQSALHAMHWFGIDSQIDVSLIQRAISAASLAAHVPKQDDIAALETKLSYTFSVKFLLQQAVTHGSMQEKDVSYTYENLEFLGDAVLDLLVTWHLYQTHSQGDAGELTDLRTASVSNNNFALVAVKRNLFVHLQHCSSTLETQIYEYVQALSELDETERAYQPPNAPKVLGDMVEGIAGAMVIDAGLDLGKVWAAFEPLLSPIVTPQDLQLHPVRKLVQLCQSLGYFVQEERSCSDRNVELKVQLGDCLLVGEGSGASIKVSKAAAASNLLAQFEKRGITYTIGSKRKREADFVTVPCFGSPNDCKKLKQDPVNTVTVTKNTKKGGPRMSLHEFCKKIHWPMPTFATNEEQLKKAMEFDDGETKRKGFVRFVSTVKVTDPSNGALECTGDARPEKKSSLDSAALKMLALLQHHGLLRVTSRQ